MARVAIARQQVSDAGLTPVYSPANPDGHSVENSGGKLILHVRNNGEEELVLTIRSGYTVNGLRLEDRRVVIPGGGGQFVGPIKAEVYNQPGSSEVWIDYSVTDGVEVAALLIP